MVHIKLFESMSDLESDVRDIFHEYIFDDEVSTTDAEYAGELIVKNNQVTIIIYGPDRVNLINNVEDFDASIKDTLSQVEFMKKMRSLCYRLKTWGYSFDFGVAHDPSTTEYYIKVYGEVKFDLKMAFENGYLKEHTLKRVLKSDYGLQLRNVHSGSDGNSKYFIIYFSTPIPENHKLINDFKKIFNSVRPYHAHENGYISIKCSGFIGYRSN
jgi:hypothetical protein